MPSNKDLIAEAEGLGKELGMEITTQGLNNKALCALVSNLKEAKKAAEDAKADETTEVSEDAKADETTEVGPKVAKGKTITSLKGILTEGTPVAPNYFSGGQKTFDSLKAKGFIS